MINVFYKSQKFLTMRLMLFIPMAAGALAAPPAVPEARRIFNLWLSRVRNATG